MKTKKTKKKKPYKPYKFDSNKKRAWLDAYGKTYNISASCQAVRISRQTFYEAIDKDPKFKERYKQAEEILVDAVESKLYSEAIHEGALGALIFILCNRRPERWRNVQKQPAPEGAGFTFTQIIQVVNGKNTNRQPEIKTSSRISRELF